MQLIQILLPVFDNGGKRISRSLFRQTAVELAKEFGGVTAYTHSPAEGLWRPRGGRLQRDDIVVFEVMSTRRDTKGWARRRRELEKTFRQATIVVRALHFDRL